jgi:hypothetical protein
VGQQRQYPDYLGGLIMFNKHNISIISACMCPDGTPAFACNEVAVAREEAENGVQYHLVEAELLKRGYEEPFVHFAEEEMPPILFAAIREYLGLTAVNEPVLQPLS